MKLRHILAIAPLALGCGSEDTGPFITNAEVEYYEVEGNTCEQAKEDIFGMENGKGFPAEGRRVAGKTHANLMYRRMLAISPLHAGSEGEYCCMAFIDSLAVSCDAIVYLPQWDGNNKCWNRFIDALAAYEQGHVDICLDYEGRLHETLSGLESTKCSEESMGWACTGATDDLDMRIIEEEVRMSMEHRRAQYAYEDEADFGLNQGAVLDCDCE